MNDVQHFVNEYHGSTTLHPLGMAVFAVLAVATFFAPRRYAAVPLLVLACCTAPAQRVVIASFDFTLIRLLALVGCFRVAVVGDWRGLRWRSLDTAFVLWAVARLILASRTRTLGGGGLNAFIYQAGLLIDDFGIYFFCRCVIRSIEDIGVVARALILISLPSAVAFAVEHLTGRNMFAVFGGVKEITDSRAGRLRCMGPFSHPILAGCFWACAMPLMASQIRRPGWTTAALAGLASAAAIVVFVASSTPVGAVMAGALGLALYPFRRWMRIICWTTFAGLVGLHLVMTAPVWHLLARVTLVTGSTSYHRYVLIDRAIEHFDEWWLVGSTLGTAHWGRQLFDVTNLYVALGVAGGLPLLGLFVAMIYVAFRAAGRARVVAESRTARYTAWALGVVLFQHAVNFLAVTYFGQMVIPWYMLLAMIASVAPSVAEMAERLAEDEDEEDDEAAAEAVEKPRAPAAAPDGKAALPPEAADEGALVPA